VRRSQARRGGLQTRPPCLTDRPGVGHGACPTVRRCAVPNRAGLKPAPTTRLAATAPAC